MGQIPKSCQLLSGPIRLPRFVSLSKAPMRGNQSTAAT